jgi:hypothetical protein
MFGLYTLCDTAIAGDILTAGGTPWTDVNTGQLGDWEPVNNSQTIVWVLIDTTQNE